MRKLMLPICFALLISAALFSGCKKDEDDKDDYTCTTCTNEPEALAANDNSSAGVYKGTLLGSTGSIAIVLLNGGTTTEAYVVFDGIAVTLTTTDLANWTPGQAITNALFTGNYNGDPFTANFSVDANGQNPTVTCNLTGHTIVADIYKELSTSLVKVFEGSYEGDNSGGLNVLFQGNDFIIITSQGKLVENTLVNGRMEFTSSGGTVIEGDFVNNDLMRGTWVETDGDNGTWEIRRSL